MQSCLGSRRAGAATVEFAVALPIFFLIILVLFETWRFQQFQQAVDQATLEASRVAILPGATVQDATQAGRVILDAVGAHFATINITPNPINTGHNRRGNGEHFGVESRCGAVL